LASAEEIADLRKLWPVGGNMVELSDQDDNSQGVLSSLVLKLEVLVQSYEDIKAGGGFLHQCAVRERPPAHFRDGLHFVAREG